MHGRCPSRLKGPAPFLQWGTSRTLRSSLLLLFTLLLHHYLQFTLSLCRTTATKQPPKEQEYIEKGTFGILQVRWLAVVGYCFSRGIVLILEGPLSLETGRHPRPHNCKNKTKS